MNAAYWLVCPAHLPYLLRPTPTYRRDQNPPRQT